MAQATSAQALHFRFSSRLRWCVLHPADAMGYAKRSSSSLFATCAAAGAALLVLHFFLLTQLHNIPLPRHGAMAEEPEEKVVQGSRLTPKELGYTSEILDSGLLQPGSLFAQEAADTGLQFQFMAQGYNNGKALVMSLHNSNRGGDPITLDLPAGMLFAPAVNRDFQNLVLRDSVSVSLRPGETKRIEQWAFCGNQFHMPPFFEMKPSGWVMNTPRCQGCVWQATAPYEMPVPAAEGHWMTAKLATALSP